MPVETQVSAVSGLLSQAALDADAEIVAVPIFAGPGGAVVPEAEVGAYLPYPPAEVAALYSAQGEAGELVAAPLPLGDRLRELVLYGVGDGSPGALRKAGAALARRARGRGAVAAGVPGEVAAFVEGALLASYEFKIGAPPKRAALRNLVVVTESPAAEEAARGAVTARAVALARDLANTPSNEKSPAWLAERAQKVAAESGLAVRIRDEDELAAQGFGGILTVGQGSARPPRLIELTYAAPGADRHVVLVGKGITFDSGGLSLKPTEGMKTMKTDMAGGAAVIAVMSALRAVGAKVRVTGLIPAAENMPSGSAMRPSDVITHFGGKTSEVLNTDAEGRLVLADALAYAAASLEPDAIVDIATLTGAAKVALGLRHGALFATTDDLAAALTAAGASSGDPVWRLPLSDEYRPAIDSDVADINNTGRGGYGAGSITAALFLREFTAGLPWAHLDVAGPARATSDNAEITKGATGFGVRLLLSWLTA